MEKSQLNLEETRRMFLSVAGKMRASTDFLTGLDKAVGDGDHGIGMARGFEAVVTELEKKNFDSIGALLQAIGTALMMSIGGASGAIFGTLFRGGGSSLMREQKLNSRVLSRMLSAGLDSVQARGKAKPGDKTMVDALEPAAKIARELVDAPLYQSLIAITEDARQGMEKTKGMVATTGKAKTLGTRAIGHADPGSASLYLILKSMMEFVTACDSMGSAA